MRELLESVRRGDRDAQNQLFQDLSQDERLRKTIRSLTYRKSVMEREDVAAEFWRGVLQGVQVVRHDIGDPVLHLIKQGVWQVKSVVKAELNKRVVQLCEKCGCINGEYNFKRLCAKCGASVANLTRNEDIDGMTVDHSYLDRIASVTQVEVTRPISAVQCRMLELLIQACIDGSEFPQSDVARMMNVSRERVRQLLAKIRPYVRLVAVLDTDRSVRLHLLGGQHCSAGESNVHSLGVQDTKVEAARSGDGNNSVAICEVLGTK